MKYFRVSSRIFEDPEFHSLSSSSKLLWFFILSLGAQRNHSEILLSSQLTATITGVRPRWFRVSLEELEKFQWVTVLPRDESVPKVKESKVKLSKGKGSKGETAAKPPKSPPKKTEPDKLRTHWLAELWNEHCGKLSKCRIPISESRLKQIKTRTKSEPDREVWVEGIQRLADSDFCNGANDRAWVADFGFLLKPDSLNKILEGKYDNRTPLQNITKNPHLLSIPTGANSFPDFNEPPEVKP